jgi:uncharacterized protein
MAIKVVVDTNVLVASLSSKSAYHWIIRYILDEKIEMYITNEIMLEYEEILKQKYSVTVAAHFLTALKELPNVHLVQVWYNWNLLSDVDDNKFVDCYIAAAAHYLVTNDTDFKVLKAIPFPKVIIATVNDFENTLKN